MLEHLIPNFVLEKRRLTQLANAGWIMGYNVTYAGPEYLENAYPDEWRRIYEQRNYWFVDPVASWSFTGNGSIRWSEITYTLDRKPMMDHARMFGLRYGACFAVNEDNQKSFLTLSHKEREFTDGEIADLHARFITWHSFVNRPIELTEDEKEVLRLFRSGLNRQGVAEAAEVSEATVKRRMHDANAKMRCKSTAQAVAYATARKLI